MRRSLLAVALGALLAGCSGAKLGEPASAPPSEKDATSREAPAAAIAKVPEPAEITRSSRCIAGTAQRLGTSTAAYAALASGTTVVYARPGGPRLRTFGPRNVNGYPTVFAVAGQVLDETCAPSWYRVQIPVRPNGTTGYVRAGSVEIVGVKARIEVDLSERRIELFRNGSLVMRLPTAIGSPETPTPTGRYYVNQRLTVTDPSGPFGPAALGISAFSPVLTNWPQGGPVAIHGTNDPSSIGRAVSNGCLRVENDALLRLFELTPAGTPVLISR
jgi:lipoprotein-anchoring transpeptidase ErfK/SrfK